MWLHCSGREFCLDVAAGLVMILSKIVNGCLIAAAALWTGPAHDRPAASTAAMEVRLRAIYRENDWRGDPNKTAERAAYLKAALQSGKLTAEQRKFVYPQIANELLKSGDAEGAVNTLIEYASWVASAHVQASAEVEQNTHELKALAYLRLGEQENCVAMHGQHSCVFPLRATGVHALPRGAEGAVRELTWLLEHRREDALSQWLLNVAYMQLGRYPRDVPAKWLLPMKLFASEGDAGEFLDYASLAGVDVTGHAGGAIVEDFDGDGLLDIVTSSSGPLDQMHLFHNNGDGTFSDWTKKAGLEGELGGLNLVLTDYDNDGHPDILVLRGGWWGKFGNYPLSLLRNRGDGTFEDVTERAGLLHLGPTQTAAWADYDNDGWLDLFVGYESTEGNHQASMLYHNNHDGTFTEVGHGMGLSEMGFVKGVAWGDFNNDGRPDLYVSVREGRNRLLRNDGPENASHPDASKWKFTDVSAKADIVPKANSFATWFFDYDNDGWPDIFVAGYSADSMQDVGRFEMGKPFKADLPHLYRNNHDGTFSDVTHEVRLDRAILTMGSNFGDLDNDGWLDIYLGNGEPSFQALLPNRMFRNAGGHSFEDVTTAGGFGHLQKGHAVVFADIENRGQEDVFEEMGGAFPGDTYESSLYRNPGHAGHSITLKLEGIQTNRAAYGARVEVIFHETGKERHVFRTVGAVSSFGANPVEQHIGVGSAAVVDEVRIRWPAHYDTEQIFQGVMVDRYYRIREGVPRPEVVARKTFRLGAGRPHAHADDSHAHKLERN